MLCTLKIYCGAYLDSVVTSVALLGTSDKYFCFSFTILASVANVNISPSITEMNHSLVCSSDTQQLFCHPNSLIYGLNMISFMVLPLLVCAHLFIRFNKRFTHHNLFREG